MVVYLFGLCPAVLGWGVEPVSQPSHPGPWYEELDVSVCTVNCEQLTVYTAHELCCTLDVCKILTIRFNLFLND